MAKKIERREGTSTEGRGLGFSFAADNVERGDPDVDFEKRRPTYPWGDDPRGREIDFESSEAGESYASKNQVFRAYRGQAPLEGQGFGMPSRVGSLNTVSDLRPELPDRSVDTAALDAAKEEERELLEASDFGRLFPQAGFVSPAPGASFSPGSELRVEVDASDLRGIYGAVLQIDGLSVERRRIDPRDRDSNKNHKFIFIYNIPADKVLGPMDITVRVFNINTSAQGMIADDAINLPPLADDIKIASGSLDGRIGRAGSTSATNPQLQQTGILRTPEAVVNITVNIA